MVLALIIQDYKVILSVIFGMEKKHGTYHFIHIKWKNVSELAGESLVSACVHCMVTLTTFACWPSAHPRLTRE
jgi:hypothetical protein